MSGRSPKREPMVSTGSASAQASTLAATTPIRMPGQAGRSRLSTTISTTVSAASPTAAGLTVFAAPASAVSLGRNALGSWPASRRPSRSCSWLAKMMTAMPAVKPTVTG